MSGLLRRLKRRRPATADENRPPETASSEPAAASAETPAESGGQAPAPEQPTVVLPVTSEQPLPAWTVAASQPTTVATSQPTAFAAQPAPARDLPAGVDPGDLAAAPAASARRGKLRRRLRYLRHVRELLLRDLGGFTYEIHRTAGGNAQEPHRRLTAAKAERLEALDAEMLALETRLGEPHAETVLREPGIGGTCPECGELHGSDAHFCARCGAPLDEKARAQRAAAEEPLPTGEAQPTTGSHVVAEPQPASVLWAGGPRPAREREEEEVAQPPAEVTSQWLATDQPTTFDRAARPEEGATGTAGEPAAADATTSTNEPAAAAAPTTADDPATADKPAAANEAATKAEEPVAKAEEPVAKADEPATADEPAVADKPAAADESATNADEPAALDEPATAVDVPQAEPVPAKPKRAAKPRKRAPAKPRAKDFEANGRRDEDVPPPISSGDPLSSPREQGS
jgi:hypothetical protein